ncbi:DUF2501 domain-containing protein [Pseudoxanthomonas sp. 10H]|uniref:DUF2501 domain-containing protein n=1 Tax=Pseudoxanthomonas sp. 10H TaxID=3242729 RepID=UPI003558213F
MFLRILSGAFLLALAASAAAIDPKDVQRVLPTGSGTATAGKTATPGIPGMSGVPGLSLPGMGADTASNAAGVLQYCVKRKYLGGDAVSSVSSRLLAGKGLTTPAKADRDAGYQSGLKGVLQGSDGTSFNFDSVPDKLKDQACDQVLKHASSLV